MYKKILVPLDGSERAEAVIPHVENLAKHDEAQVVFVQVVEPEPRTAILNLNKDQEVAFKPQKIDQIAQYLTNWQDQFRSQGLSADILLLHGVAVDAILHAIQVSQADLVAMTSRGRTGLAKVFFGSVAAGILNRIECPLMLVRSATNPNLKTNKRILVPLDGSVRAEAILPHAEGIAKLYNATIVLTQVVRSNYQTASVIDLDREITEELVSDKLFNKLGQHQEIERVKEAKRYLLDWQAQLRDQGFEVEANLLFGKPIESIIQVAETIDADLIAMTSKGHTGLDRVFYGSVTSGLLNRLERPLLVVRAGDLPIKNFV